MAHPAGRAAAAVLLVLLVAMLISLPRSQFLEISDSGQVLLRLPVGASDALGLDYTHSIYDAPVHEVYRLTADRGLVLVSAASSAAALEYSALWPDGYLPDGTAYVALDRPIGVLELSVDQVGRPVLVLDGTRLDLRALLGGEGRVRMAVVSESRLAVWLDSVFRVRALVAEDAETGVSLWSGPIFPGELFTLSFTVASYGDRVAETFAVSRDNSLVIRQAAYGSGALAADCSIQCDRLGRSDGDFGPARLEPALVFRLTPASGLELGYRGARVSLITDGDHASRLRVAAGPATWPLVARGR